MLAFASVGLFACQVSGQTAAKPAMPNYQFPSAELNKELPKWLKFSGNYQGRFEGFTGGGYKPNSSDAYFLNRFRLNMLIAPSPWLRFNFQAQDARVWGKNQNPPVVPFQNTLDLRQAYVEIGDSETKAWGVRAGRQELVFGEQRLIGHLNWVNDARSFDAVRATWRHKGARVDAFASTVVTQVDGEFDRAIRVKADNFHGIWANLPTLVKGVTIEPYLLWRVTRNLKSETGILGKRDFKTYGIRFSGKVAKVWDYTSETNGQKGSLANDSIGAFAGHWQIGYTMPKAMWKPRWLLEYNYATGDKNPTDNKRGTFDQLYPTGHDKL
ncbi:MAG: alginate export family protein, partial [Acidobacteriota bacterium]